MALLGGGRERPCNASINMALLTEGFALPTEGDKQDRKNRQETLRD